MGDSSAIEWTDATWNPVTGCTKVSPACANCYIERTPPFRIRGRKFVKGHIPVELHPDRLDAPLKRRKPTMYFVNSLSDLFHEDVPDVFIDRVFAVMALALRHTFQVLTKRPERMRDYMMHRDRPTLIARQISEMPLKRQYTWEEARSIVFGIKLSEDPPQSRWPLRNVWLGVSVENQTWTQRIVELLQTPAAVRFISAEPLLGELHVKPFFSTFKGIRFDSGLDWVIVGGESGPRLRPTDPNWVRAVRDECVAAGVPFFFKQWGGRTAKSGGRLLDGREWNEMPEARS